MRRGSVSFFHTASERYTEPSTSRQWLGSCWGNRVGAQFYILRVKRGEKRL